MEHYKISYAAFTMTGRRTNNEDNLLCCGFREDAVHQDSKTILSGSVETAKPQIFGVFDGLGGESAGEMASFLAADSFGQQDLGRHIHKEQIEEMYRQANDSVVSYMRENGIGSMGTTAAVVIFGGDGVWISNIGDSRIYSVSENRIRQLSVDHVAGRYGFGKPPLSQCLGVPQEEFMIAPEIYRTEKKGNTCFLLCSDGVSDCLSQRELLKIIRQDSPLTDKLMQIIEKVRLANSPDNATAILLYIG